MLVGKIIYFTFSFLMILFNRNLLIHTEIVAAKSSKLHYGIFRANGFHTYCIYVV